MNKIQKAMTRVLESPQSRVEILLLALLIVSGAFFRFYRVGIVPPGLQYDEAYKLIDILSLFQGRFFIFFPANEGREPLYFYLATVFYAFFGPQAIALRINSAIIGTLSIPIIYGFARSLFGSARVAFLAAALSAFSVWHLFFSRLGTRNILVVLVTTLALWFFWRGITHFRRRDYALAGVFTALSTYTYLTGRLLPIIFVGVSAVAMIADRKRARSYFGGLLITGAIAFVLFLPLGIYFWQHPDQFVSHAQNLSVLDPRVGRGDPAAALFNNLTAVGGMFLMRGDHEEFRNIPNRPVFDPVSGVFFLMGVALLVFSALSPRVEFKARLRSIYIALASGVFLAVSVLSDDPPVFTRTIAALPLVMILPAWAFVWLWDRLAPRVGSRPFIAFAAIGLIGFASLTFKDYFVDFAKSPTLYYTFGVEKTDAANWINQNSRTTTVFMAPLWMRDSTLLFLTRETAVRSLETKDTVVLPARSAGNSALFAFPMEQDKKAAKLGERLGALATSDQLIGSNGKPILIYYRVAPNDLPDTLDPYPALSKGGAFIQPQKITHASWENQIELLGYSIEPEGPGGRNLAVTLFVRGLRRMAEDHTFSVKARDHRDRAWGQEDKWLGDNSYPTTRWDTGDLVIEKFYPGLHACAPAGDYQITVEVYNPQTLKALSADNNSTIVPLGRTRAEASTDNRLEDLDPERIIEKEVAPQTRLMGYTLTPADLQAGDPFILQLYWRGANNASPRDVSVRLRDSAHREHALAQKMLALPIAGRGLCTLFDLRAPSEVALGKGALLVNDVEIANVNVR